MKSFPSLKNRFLKIVLIVTFTGIYTPVSLVLAATESWSVSTLQGKDTDTLDIIIEQIYDLYYAGQFDAALNQSQKILHSCESNGDLNGIVQMLNVQGNLHRLAGNFEKALQLFNLSLEHFKALANAKGQASTLNQIGSIYRMQGNYPGALEFFFSAVKLYNQANDSIGLSKTYNNIGIVYFYQKNYDKALEFYHHSLKVDQHTNDEYGVSVSFINIGEVYKYKGNYKQALDYFLRALVLAKKHEEKDDDKDGVGVLYNEIGSIYMELGDLQLSKTYLNQALEIFTEIGSKQRLAECHINLGDHALKSGNINKAYKHFSNALSYAKTIKGLDLISQANKKLSDIFELKGDYHKAFDFYKTHIQTRDSLFNDDNTKRSVQTEMLYQFDKQLQESKLEQAKKDALLQEVARRQSLLRNFMAIVLVLLVVVVIVIYNAFKSKQKANELLKEQQKQIIEKNEELLQQQEEILAQRDEIEHKNKILLETQQIVEAKNERIISSIEYAQTIQEAILPNEEQLKQYFPEHMVIFMPKDIVSGDFYWFSSFDNLLFAAVIDCTGHGVPGSFMSLIGNTMLNQIINEWQTRDPALILELMNIQVRKALKQDLNQNKAHASMDVCLVSIDQRKKKATFAGASRPLYYIQDNKLLKIPGDPRSVGGYQRETKRYFTNHEINIKSSTCIYLTTDGYIDQMNERLIKFGPKRFIKLLYEVNQESMNKQKDILQNAILDYKKSYEQIDDICILGLKL